MVMTSFGWECSRPKHIRTISLFSAAQRQSFRDLPLERKSRAKEATNDKRWLRFVLATPRSTSNKTDDLFRSVFTRANDCGGFPPQTLTHARQQKIIHQNLITSWRWRLFRTRSSGCWELPSILKRRHLSQKLVIIRVISNR